LRNVVTLSDIPPELHTWLREEAARQTVERKTKVHIYSVVIEACHRYKYQLENPVLQSEEVSHAG